MPTIVTYNGIEMHSVATLRFNQAPQYDPSGTDVLFSRFTLSFEGLLHAGGDQQGAPVWIAPSGKGGGFSPTDQAYKQLMTLLWTPRQHLLVTMGGATIFECYGPGDDALLFDLDNGPKPKNVQLSHITSSSSIGPTFRVTFEIECARSCCGNGTVQPVVDNRWSIAEGFDEECFTTRSIMGRLRVSDSTKYTPDWYRGLVFPSLENGFRRERFDYNVATNGLDVDYVVTDKQVHTSAPWPCMKINVRHTEGTSNGGKFDGECHVQLKGHPGASKISMFTIGTRILEDRLGNIRDLTKNGQCPVAYTMTDIIGERNEVELFLKIQHAVPDLPGSASPASNYLGTPVGALGVPLGAMLTDDNGTPISIRQGIPDPNGEASNSYDPKISVKPAMWGYNSQLGDTPRVSGIVLGLLQCYLQQPCFDSHAIGLSTSTQNVTVHENPNISSGGDFDAGVDDDKEDEVIGDLSQETQANLYTFAAAETTINVNPMRVGLPIAGSPKDYKEFADTTVGVTLGWTQATITFHFECERVGDWPSLPNPIGQFSTAGLMDATSGDPDTYYEGENEGQTTTPGTSNPPITGALLHAAIVPLPATLDATSTRKIFHVSCRYTYSLNRPPRQDDPIPVGILPYTSFSQASNALKPETMFGGINSDLYQPNSNAALNAGGY